MLCLSLGTRINLFMIAGIYVSLFVIWCSLVAIWELQANETRSHLGDEDAIFALTLPGTKLYVIQDVKDILSVYKNTTTLSMEGFIRMLLTSIGLSERAIEKVTLDPKDDPDYPVNPENTGRQDLMQFARKLHRFQLLPGDALDGNSANFIRGFEIMIDAYLPSLESNSRSMSLMDLCSHTVASAGFISMLGPDFPRQHPQFVDAALDFMEESWQLLFKLPRFAAQDLYNARDRSIKILQNYVHENGPDFEETPYIWKNIVKGALALGLPEHEASALLFMFLWVYVSHCELELL